MPVILPISTAVVPLSLGAIGPHRHDIVGRIEPCTSGCGRDLGQLLVTDRCKEAFSHPTLFADATIADRTGGWVIVTQEGRDPARLVMRPYCLNGRRVPSGEVRFRIGEVARARNISADAVILLVRTIDRSGGRCTHPECEAAQDYPLDLRQTVLIQEGLGPAPLCVGCYGKESERIPGFATRVLIDGRRLPPCAPVGYLSAL